MTDETTHIATAAPFSGDWESAADIIADFKIAPEALADAHIIAAHYVFEDYEGSAYVLFEKDGNLYEVQGSHCSCYGLEGQWEPRIETPESLIHRAKASNGEYPMYDAAEKVLAYLAAPEAPDDPYAALSQHLHGDGDDDAPQAADACATPGCTNPPVIRLDDRRLCLDCYATHDFGDDA